MGTSSRAPARSVLLAGLHLAGRRLSAATIMFHQAVADRLGLNITDHKCLDLVLLNGPMTAGALAEATGMTTGAITAALDRLERAGFVQRADDPSDRRKVLVRVIPDRLAEVCQIFEPLAAFQEELASRYDDTVLAGIVDFLTRCCAGLHQSTIDLREQAEPDPKRKRAVPGGRGRTPKPSPPTPADQ
jgi:DNA-binding MarR family transcriptional regulator